MPFINYGHFKYQLQRNAIAIEHTLNCFKFFTNSISLYTSIVSLWWKYRVLGFRWVIRSPWTHCLRNFTIIWVRGNINFSMRRIFQEPIMNCNSSERYHFDLFWFKRKWFSKDTPTICKSSQAIFGNSSHSRKMFTKNTFFYS